MGSNSIFCSILQISVEEFSCYRKWEDRITNDQMKYCGEVTHLGHAKIIGIYERFGILYQCNDCECRWLSCSVCPKARVILKSKKAIHNHKGNKNHKANLRLVMGLPAAEKRVVPDTTHHLGQNGVDDTPPCCPESKRQCVDNSSSIQESEDEYMIRGDHYDDGDFIIGSVDDNLLPCSPLSADAKELDEISKTSLIVDNGRALVANHQLPFAGFHPGQSLGFRGTRNVRFFDFCSGRPKEQSFEDAGIEYLAKTCLLDDSRMLPNDLRNVSPMPKDFQQLLMKCCRMCHRTGKKDRDLLCSILQQTLHQGMHDGWVNSVNKINEKYNSVHPITDVGRDYILNEIAEDFSMEKCKTGSHVYSRHLPTTPDGFRAIYVGNKNSILQNLPHPQVRYDDTGHAYVSLEDCLRDAFAHSACRAQVLEQFDTRIEQTEVEPLPQLGNCTDSFCDVPQHSIFELDNGSDDMEAENSSGDDEDDGGLPGIKKRSAPLVGAATDGTAFDYSDDNSYSDSDDDGAGSEISEVIGDDLGKPGTAYSGVTKTAPISDSQHHCGSSMGDDGSLTGDEFEAANDIEDANEVSVCHPSRSRRAREIYNEAKRDSTHDDTNVIYLIFWSDDCDTNSQSMSGRAQVFVKTMTIATTPNDPNWLGNTYPVIIGPKKASHDVVERVHADELRRLQSRDLAPFYVGDKNQMIRLQFRHLANLGDQPEKRAMNATATGNSKYGARSFVSADHFSIYQRLKACRKCRLSNKQRFRSTRCITKLPHCSCCLNWDARKEDTDLALTPLPAHYPFDGLVVDKLPITVPGRVDRITIKEGQRWLRTFDVTYDSLATAITEAHEGIVECGWSERAARVFLEVEGFNGAFIDKILSHAKRARSLRVDSTCGTLHAALRRSRDNNPSLFSKPPPPAVHSRPGVPLSSHLEALMHLLFLGMVKTTVISGVQRSLKMNNQNTAFISANAKYLLSVVSLKLDWLKALPYSGGKFYGWNSENWLGFLRVMQWFYQNYSETEKRPPPAVVLPPEENQEAWKMEHNKHWLKLRRLHIGKSNAEQLRQKVAAYMKKRPPYDVIPPPEVQEKEIECLITSLHDMVACIMGPRVSEHIAMKTEYAIRIFLSGFDDLDARLRGPKKKPQVITTYNCLCLLNLPQHMREYGPLRHFWEGKIQGEGFLPRIKEWHTQGIRTNWAPNLLRNVLRDRAFDNLLGGQRSPRLPSTASPTDVAELQLFAKSFKKYGGVVEVNDILEESRRERKQALSVIIVRCVAEKRDAAIYAVIGEDCDVIRLAKSKTFEPTVRFGLHYYKFEVAFEGEDRVAVAWESEIATFHSPHLGFAVLLPLLVRQQGTANCLFAVVSSNWKQLGPMETLDSLVE